MARTRRFRILLVEDNDADIVLTRQAFKAANAPVELAVAHDGVEALESLESARDQKRLPDLILLDLNMPRMDGRQLLSQLKSNPSFQKIPVVVLTTSNAPGDVDYSYRHHTNAFLTKAPDFDEFHAQIESLDDFWLGRATLPSGG